MTGPSLVGPGSQLLGPTTVVGRAAEAEILEAALRSGAHVLLEGPPGTGKSTLLREVAAARRIPFVLVEGNAELTPARLIGHFDPALVLSRGTSRRSSPTAPCWRRCAPVHCSTWKN